MSPTPIPLALVLVALVAFVIGWLTMPLVLRAGLRFGFIDQPRAGEAQNRPLPRTGGYGVFVAFFAGFLVSLPLLERFPDEWTRLTGLALGVLLIVPLAIFDDALRLPPWPQLAGQIVIAAVTVAFGIQIDQISSPLGGTVPVPAMLVVPVTIIWIVGMINTVNFADGVDGLAGGVGFIAATILFLVSFSFGQFSIAALPLALAASVLAFLRWNFYPSRLILGTSGATLIGYLLAVLSIIGGAKIATALMVLGLPIADVATVILSRLARGRSPFHGGDRAHLHHRLLDLGLDQRQVAMVFYVICLCFGLLAVVVERLGRLAGLVGLSLVVAGLLAYVVSRRPVAKSES